MIRYSRDRITDGQYDDESWATIDPEVIDAAPRERPVSSGQRKRLTVKQRQHMVRNAAIMAAYRGGLSHRMLALAFGLPRSSISEILAGRQTYWRRRDHSDRDAEPA